MEDDKLNNEILKQKINFDDKYNNINLNNVNNSYNSNS